MQSNDPERRRPSPAVLLRRIATLAAETQQIGADAGSRGNASILRTPDPMLIRSCRRLAQVERRKLALFHGPASTGDDAARDTELDILDRAQHSDLDRVTRMAPSSWQGHRLRAATFQLMDAGGLYTAARSGSAIDRLLLAVIHDLAVS